MTDPDDDPFDEPFPTVLLPGDPPVFPDPALADADGLVAIGADLSVDWLLAAYRAGVFPWYSEETPPLWWSPEPRAVITADSLRVSRRLARTIRGGGFSLSWNTSFAEVMAGCAENRDDGTWILPEMIEAYTALHEAGHAHSLEVRCDGELVGGIYGVQVGGLFAAESKFHRVRDASKVALVALVRLLAAAGIAVVDVQFLTPHLESLGAVEWSRPVYLSRLSRLIGRTVDLRAVDPCTVDHPAVDHRAIGRLSDDQLVFEPEA